MPYASSCAEAEASGALTRSGRHAAVASPTRGASGARGVRRGAALPAAQRTDPRCFATWRRQAFRSRGSRAGGDAVEISSPGSAGNQVQQSRSKSKSVLDSCRVTGRTTGEAEASEWCSDVLVDGGY